MYAKQVTGPNPLSCVTCRERRKKCDRTHPTCNRCKTSGFTCLGYVSRGQRATNGPLSTSLNRSAQSSILRSGQLYCHNSIPLPILHDEDRAINGTGVSTWHPHLQGSALSPVQALPVPTQQPNDSLHIDYPTKQPAPPQFSGDVSGCALPERLDIFSPSTQTGYISNDIEPSTRALVGPQRTSRFEHRIRNGNVRRVGNAEAHLSIYPDIDRSVVIVEFITSQFERAYKGMAVELVVHRAKFVQDVILAGIPLSKSSCWSLYLGAKIFQAVMDDFGPAHIKPHLKKLDRFEEEFSGLSLSKLAPRERMGWLSAALGVFELRALVDFRVAYKSFLQVAPLFMQVAYADPTLLSQQGRLVEISLHKVLISPRAELIRFATMDVMMATMFGLPHLVPWNITLFPNISRVAIISEWIPGYPSGFILAFAMVNTWRTRDVYARDLNEWRRVEAHIKDCHPHHPANNVDSFQTIARFAVQEAVRQAALIYLYMGMCGLTSRDFRVQNSCKQIVHLLAVVDANPNMAIHFVFPAVTAGICAFKERHRSIIYNVLRRAPACKPFPFKNIGFFAVMDYFWHGPAKDGAETTWEEYLATCRAVVSMEQ